MLKQQYPQYGIFAHWPQDGQGFVHPDDVAVVRRCIPSERVMRRDSFDGTYYHYRYGSLRFRLRPCLWLKIHSDGIDIGDRVETIGLGMERELFVAEVCGMHFARRKGCIVYRLRRGDKAVPNLYTADQMRLLTIKPSVHEGYTKHPSPSWDGSGETMKDWDANGRQQQG